MICTWWTARPCRLNELVTGVCHLPVLGGGKRYEVSTPHVPPEADPPSGPRRTFGGDGRSNSSPPQGALRGHEHGHSDLLCLSVQELLPRPACVKVIIGSCGR